MLVARDRRKANYRTPLQALQEEEIRDQRAVGNHRQKLGWKRPSNKKIFELFRKDEATGAILQFLKDKDVGKIKKGH